MALKHSTELNVLEIYFSALYEYIGRQFDTTYSLVGFSKLLGNISTIFKRKGHKYKVLCTNVVLIF